MSEPKRPHGSRFRDALVIMQPERCRTVANRRRPSAEVERTRGGGAVRPSRSCREPQQGLRSAHDLVGVLSRERGSPMREFDPCACSHQYSLSPTRKRVGMRRREHPAP